jgi:quercetin dioxygenase-like cupin family protein
VPRYRFDRFLRVLSFFDKFEEIEMRVVKISEVKKEPFRHPLFTGSDLTRQVLLPDSKEFEVNVVNFGKGVRNKFHVHDSEQILLASSGKGVIAMEAEEKVIVVGDIVIISAGEKRWHGAARDSEFSHIYITRLGSEVTQLEKLDPGSFAAKWREMEGLGDI